MKALLVATLTGCSTPPPELPVVELVSTSKVLDLEVVWREQDGLVVWRSEDEHAFFLKLAEDGTPLTTPVQVSAESTYTASPMVLDGRLALGLVFPDNRYSLVVVNDDSTFSTIPLATSESCHFHATGHMLCATDGGLPMERLDRLHADGTIAPGAAVQLPVQHGGDWKLSGDTSGILYGIDEKGCILTVPFDGNGVFAAPKSIGCPTWLLGDPEVNNQSRVWLSIVSDRIDAYTALIGDKNGEKETQFSSLSFDLNLELIAGEYRPPLGHPTFGETSWYGFSGIQLSEIQIERYASTGNRARTASIPVEGYGIGIAATDTGAILVTQPDLYTLRFYRFDD